MDAEQWPAVSAILREVRAADGEGDVQAAQLTHALLRSAQSSSTAPFSLMRRIHDAAVDAGVPSDAKLYDHLLSACIAHRQQDGAGSALLDDCLALLSRGLRASDAAAPPLHSTAVCNRLLHAALLSERFEYGEALLSQMKAAHPPLLADSLTLSLLLQCALSLSPAATSLARALSLYSDVREWAGREVAPSSAVYAQLMRRCVVSAGDARGEGAGAAAYVPLLYADLIDTQRRLDADHACCLLEAFHALGLHGEALREFERLDERGVRHSDSLDVVALHVLLHSRAPSQRALDLVEDIRRRHAESAGPTASTPTIVAHYRRALLLAAEQANASLLLALLSLLSATPWRAAVLGDELTDSLLRRWAERRPLTDLVRSVGRWRQQQRGEEGRGMGEEGWEEPLLAAVERRAPNARAALVSAPGNSAWGEARERVYGELAELLALDEAPQARGLSQPSPPPPPPPSHHRPSAHSPRPSAPPSPPTVLGAPPSFSPPRSADAVSRATRKSPPVRRGAWESKEARRLYAVLLAAIERMEAEDIASRRRRARHHSHSGRLP